MRLAALILPIAFASACASDRSNGNGRQFTLLTSTSAQQMSLGTSGQITGPNLQLAPTADGYRGMANSAIIELRSNGRRIQGTINDRVIDLHVELHPDGLEVRGMFGGKLGRLEATNSGIVSSLGGCHFELEVKSYRYVGSRACGGGGLVPIVHPAALELPSGFERLRPDRQAMLLAILLGQ